MNLPWTKARCIYSETDHLKDIDSYARIVKSLVGEYPELKVYDPTKMFCEDGFCKWQRDGHSLYLDNDHMSVFGSERVGKDFAAWLAKLN